MWSKVMVKQSKMIVLIGVILEVRILLREFESVLRGLLLIVVVVYVVSRW